MNIQRRTLRLYGRLLILVGGVSLGMYAVPVVYGAAMSRLAVATFRAESTSHRTWDAARILAYRQTLSAKLQPPEAVLRISRVGLEVPVLEGVDEMTMNRAAGHIPGTSLPGAQGNVGIAGHRDGFFRVLKDVTVGDRIELERKAGGVTVLDVYVVQGISIVPPSDTSALRATAGSTLTLVTCYPFYFVGPAPQRFVVRAALLSPSASSSSVLEPTSGD